MPTADTYEDLTVDELHERLALAEAACVLMGWGTPKGLTNADAVTQAWMEWAHHVGTDYLSPSTHPDLNERRIHELGETRQQIRDATLRSIREEDDEPARGVRGVIR